MSTIKGKYWTLKLKSEYKIPPNLQAKTNNNDSTYPDPGLNIKISCWNENQDLIFWTNNCFGQFVTKQENNNSSYYHGWLLEVKIKLRENTPGRDITSYGTFKLTDYAGWAGTVHNNKSQNNIPARMLYGLKIGIYHQMYMNKKTGSFLCYELGLKGHETDYWGKFQYHDASNNVYLRYGDRRDNIYSNSVYRWNPNIACENNSYLGTMGFIELPDSNLSAQNRLRISFLKMDQTRVYARQCNPQYKSCGCSQVNQPGGSLNSGWNYFYNYSNNYQVATMANDHGIVHYHAPSNGIHYISLSKLNSSSCGSTIFTENIDGNGLNTNNPDSMKLPFGFYGNGTYNNWDLNNNNIIYYSNGQYSGFLNLGKKENLDNGTLKLPEKQSIYWPSGTTKYTSRWRIIDNKYIPRTSNMSQSGSFTVYQNVRILDSNIALSQYQGYFQLSKYNMYTNEIEKAELFYRGYNSPVYTAMSINENNEIVIVDLYYHRIQVWQLEENDTTTHSSTIIKGDTQNYYGLANTKDPATIEEAISVEVKHRTSIEQCEIVISPKTLSDKNLVPLDGRILIKSEEPYLYSIFKDTYRTNEVPQNSFKLPDMRGRYLIGRQSGSYSGINAQIQAFSLESLNDFGFNPINNQIKKYYKSASAKTEVNLTNDKAVKSIELKNTDQINTTRKSVSIDDKCYMFYIRKIK